MSISHVQSLHLHCRARLALMESRWSCVPVFLAYLCAIASVVYYHNDEPVSAIAQAFWAVVFFVYWRVKYGRNSLLEFLGNLCAIVYYAPQALYWWLRRRISPPPPAEPVPQSAVETEERRTIAPYYGVECGCGHITFGGPVPDDPEFFLKGDVIICGKCLSRVEIKPETVWWTDVGPESRSEKFH